MTKTITMEMRLAIGRRGRLRTKENWYREESLRWTSGMTVSHPHRELGKPFQVEVPKPKKMT